MKSKLTAADIARLSGVSRATVFSVLQGKSSVSTKTRNRVLETIEKHGYKSGLIPRALAGSMSNMVGVVLGSMRNPYWAELYSGLESVLSPEGFHEVLYHGTDDTYAGGLHAFEQGNFPPLRAYIIYGKMLAGRKQYGAFFEHIEKNDVPLIAINPNPNDLDYGHHIRYNIRDSSRQAADYLVKQGHERIGYLAGPIKSATAHERYLGYIEGLITNGIEAADNLMVRAGETAQTGYDAAIRMLTHKAQSPTAVLCYNDQCAVGVYRACHELSIRIPEDLSVVGFDGTAVAGITGPPMTTMSLFPEETGVTAGELLLEVVSRRNGKEPAKRVMEHRLIVRESVRPR